jgi:hypothetical protein
MTEELTEVRKGGVGHNVVIRGVEITGTPQNPTIRPIRQQTPAQPAGHAPARPATERRQTA